MHTLHHCLTDIVELGVYFGYGGLLMILGSIGEWIVGNTFSFVVFGTFGASILSSEAFLFLLYPLKEHDNEDRREATDNNHTNRSFLFL